MSNGIIEINEMDFELEIIKSELPVLVDFWAPWCGPCRVLGPIIENLSLQYTGKIKFAKVNVDNNQLIAVKYNIQTIPTVMFFNNGNLIGEPLIGVKNIEEYKLILDQYSNGKINTLQPKSELKTNKIDCVGLEQFNSYLSLKDKLVIVDFWAPWCGPCRMLGPILEKIAEEKLTDIILIKINVDEPQNEILAQQYGISSIPQVNFFKFGTEIHKFIGALPYEQVKQIVESLLNK